MTSSWLPQAPDTSASAQDVRYLKIDTPEKTGESVEATVRILDERPVPVWRHWFGTKPLNCPGPQQCPACFARKQARDSGDPNWRELYRMEKRYMINVGLGQEVKIWTFGNKLGGRIALYAERKELGDPRDYDLTIIKRRTGPNKLNVEYDVFPGAKTGFTPEYQGLLSQRHDLEVETTPAEPSAIKEAMGNLGANGTPPKGATILQTAELQRLASSKGYTLEQLGVNVESLTSDQAEKYIQDLKG